MSGLGRSGGASTIVNAFATGRGVAFGLAWSVTARVGASDRDEVWAGRRRLTDREARVALETVHTVQDRLGRRRPMHVRVRSHIPARRGLKSSSAVGVAVARAVLDDAGASWDDRELLSAVTSAALRSGTSLTGALDDAAACLWGGVVFTHNDRGKVLARDELPHDLVALVRVPRATLATGSLSRATFRRLEAPVGRAWRLARAGRIPEAMRANTDAYAPALGLDVSFTHKALEAGAWAAGLSGKGPAEVALVRRGEVARIRRALPACRRVELRRGDAS